tara:strand:+ start:274 stop:468 length:195 start_codon:yes stop_codon:yes gene_type:complete
MNYKKGDVVLLSDAGKVRRAKVVTDGVDSKGRVNVRPKDFPLDIYITTEVNDNLYIIKIIENGK